MHCISIVCVLILLFLGQRGKLTNDDNYKNQKSTSFTRAGSLGLWHYGSTNSFYLIKERGRPHLIFVIEQNTWENILASLSGLGTGGMIYYAVTIATVINTSDECKDVHLLIHAISGLSFIAMEIAILFKYSKVRCILSLCV